MAQQTCTPKKRPVVGVPISLTSYDGVIDVILNRPGDSATTIAVCNVHSVMTARRDDQLRRAISEADIATSDGVPLVWVLRLTASPDQRRVYGPTLMRLTLQRGRNLDLKHYLYGTTPETIARLRREIDRFAPGSEIVGSIAPPFRPLTVAEEDDVVADVRASGADIMWIGLGMPRQELFIHSMAPRLPGVALAGVGAAFDFLSGTVAQAPPWMQERGLEWAYRLSCDPRRLWRRYLFNNPAFLVLAGMQVAGYRLRAGRRGRRAA